MEIIPAIDIIDGRCVRLTQGDFARKTIYNEDPLDVAKRFEAVGLKRLHLVDLDGARSGKTTNLKLLESIARHTNLIIDFGGGLRNAEDVQRVFNLGATMVCVSSVAVNQPAVFERWLTRFGSNKFILGADVCGTRIAINGWKSVTDVELIPFLSDCHTRGVGQAFVTDIRRDGEMRGPAFELYAMIRQEVPDCKLIASGGVTSISDIEQLRQIGCSGVIIGKAIYEGKIALEELSEYAR